MQRVWTKKKEIIETNRGLQGQMSVTSVGLVLSEKRAESGRDKVDKHRVKQIETGTTEHCPWTPEPAADPAMGGPADPSPKDQNLGMVVVARSSLPQSLRQVFI